MALPVMSAVGLSLLCLLGWLVECYRRDATHADLIWVLGLGASALIYLLAGDGAPVPRWMAAALIGFWTLRLGAHILRRVLGASEEDGRYQAMRARLGGSIHRFHFFFFQAQGLLAWLFALPFWVIATNPDAVPVPALALGTGVGVLALAGEAQADRQLAHWRAEPANRGYTFRRGLWRYSRHPNYFFEWLHWFSYPLLALGAPYWGWLWLAPVLMLVFLWFVTGIPYTERQALKSRGEDYRDYQRTTSAFIPWRPKC